MSLRLKMVAGRYGIARLPADAAVPEWSLGAGFMSIVRAEDELTIVCLQDRIPQGVQADLGWICLRTIGPFDFATTGVVQSLIAPLSSNGIGVFVLCTFDGEHLLIGEGEAAKARELLLEAGHVFVEA